MEGGGRCRAVRHEVSCERGLGSVGEVGVALDEGFGSQVHIFSRGALEFAVTMVTAKYRKKFERNLKLNFEFKFFEVDIDRGLTSKIITYLVLSYWLFKPTCPLLKRREFDPLPLQQISSFF